MKGQRIAFVSKGRAELEEFTVPAAEPGKVLLKTECTLISPGTERANLLDMTDCKGWPKYLGYSAVATVLECGEGVTSLKPGDRAAVYHSIHASHQLKQECDLVRIEDPSLPAEEAVFSIVAAMGLQGLRKVRPELGESVMIMGQGLLGLFALQCAHLSGAFPLIALDFNPERRKLALELGADHAFSPDEPELEKRIAELTRGGVNAVVEVTGAPDAINLGLRCMAPMGRIALTGCSRTPTRELDFYHAVHRPGITIIGAHNFVRPKLDSRPGFWTMRDDMAMLLRYFSAGRIKTRPLISERAKPSQAPELYKRLTEGDPSMLGTVFLWN